MGLPGMFRTVADIPLQLGRGIRNPFLAGDYMRVPPVNGALANGVGAAEELARLLTSRPA